MINGADDFIFYFYYIGLAQSLFESLLSKYNDIARVVLWALL